MKHYYAMQVRLSVAEKARFSEAAEMHGLSLSSWVRLRLRGAAMKDLADVVTKSQFADSAVAPQETVAA